MFILEYTPGGKGIASISHPDTYREWWVVDTDEMDEMRDELGTPTTAYVKGFHDRNLAVGYTMALNDELIVKEQMEEDD